VTHAPRVRSTASGGPKVVLLNPNNPEKTVFCSDSARTRGYEKFSPGSFVTLYEDELYDLLWIADRKPAQQQRVDEAEDGRVGADAEGER